MNPIDHHQKTKRKMKLQKTINNGGNEITISSKTNDFFVFDDNEVIHYDISANVLNTLCLSKSIQCIFVYQQFLLIHTFKGHVFKYNTISKTLQKEPMYNNIDQFYVFNENTIFMNSKDKTITIINNDEIIENTPFKYSVDGVFTNDKNNIFIKSENDVYDTQGNIIEKYKNKNVITVFKNDVFVSNACGVNSIAIYNQNKEDEEDQIVEYYSKDVIYEVRYIKNLVVIAGVNGYIDIIDPYNCESLFTLNTPDDLPANGVVYTRNNLIVLTEVNTYIYKVNRS